MSATQRVRQGAVATITATLTDATGAVPSPLPAAATVTITRADGEALATMDDATGIGNAQFQYQLASGQTALLDRLTCVWTNADLGSVTTTVEVVGGFLFDIAELQAVDDQLAAMTSAKLAEMRTKVEAALERELGYALVPRYTRQTVRTATTLRLKPYPRAIRSVTSGGVELTSGQLATLQLTPTGSLTGYAWRYPTIVGYEHGLGEPEPEAREHALSLATMWTLSGPIDDRTTVLASPETGITSTLAIPGRGGSIFGIPTVDQWVSANRLVIGA